VLLQCYTSTQLRKLNSLQFSTEEGFRVLSLNLRARSVSQQNLLPAVGRKGLNVPMRILFSNRCTARKGRSLVQSTPYHRISQHWLFLSGNLSCPRGHSVWRRNRHQAPRSRYLHRAAATSQKGHLLLYSPLLSTSFSSKRSSNLLQRINFHCGSRESGFASSLTA